MQCQRRQQGTEKRKEETDGECRTQKGSRRAIKGRDTETPKKRQRDWEGVKEPEEERETHTEKETRIQRWAEGDRAGDKGRWTQETRAGEEAVVPETKVCLGDGGTVAGGCVGSMRLGVGSR